VLGLVVVGEHAVALDGQGRDGDVVADELDAPDRAVEPGEEHVGHVSSVAAASDIDSRESDIGKRFAEVAIVEGESMRPTSAAVRIGSRDD
jgi:hypothetical protein